MKRVIIASKNPVKISAVKQGFEKMFPSDIFDYVGVSVPSEVAGQPFSNEEIFKGAFNRATNASVQYSDADYWVGIESGIQKIDGEMESFAWVFIKSLTKSGKSRTGSFFLPPEVAKLIDEGKELCEADDIVFKRTNSKQGNGTIGILTGGVIDRAKHYSKAVVLGLIPFKNEQLY